MRISILNNVAQHSFKPSSCQVRTLPLCVRNAAEARRRAYPALPPRLRSRGARCRPPYLWLVPW
jgi:hypothetical protein